MLDTDVAERRCWRCLQMFPGDSTRAPTPTPEWWLCEPCDRILLAPGRGRRDVEVPVGCPPAGRRGVRPRCRLSRPRPAHGGRRTHRRPSLGHDVGIRFTTGTTTGPVVRPGGFAVHLAAVDDHDCGRCSDNRPATRHRHGPRPRAQSSSVMAVAVLSAPASMTAEQYHRITEHLDASRTPRRPDADFTPASGTAIT